MPESPSIRTRFPPPWRVEKTPSGYRIVSANGRNVAYIYEEGELIRRNILNYPTLAEAHSIANAISALPELMTKQEGSKS